MTGTSERARATVLTVMEPPGWPRTSPHGERLTRPAWSPAERDRMAMTRSRSVTSGRSSASRETRSSTIFWNGPMGVFELAPYASGTRTVVQALTSSDAFTVVGGGDTDAAIRALGFADTAFGYVSTGGGASLEFIQGKALPGLAALGER